MTFWRVLAGMRKKRLRQVGSGPVNVDMSSLVDLSFLLLVFFLVTTTLLAKEQDMPMALPSVSGSPGDSKPITIRVKADNRVVLHPGQNFEEEVAGAGTDHELTALRERLAMLRAGREGVNLDVQDGASYQRFMDVLNCLRGEGWDEIGITGMTEE